MIEQKYTITRTRATWKPRVTDADMPFFTDKDGNTLVALSGDADAVYTGTGRTLVGEPPYAHLNDAVESNNDPIDFIEVEDLPEGVELDYQISGGFNNNAVYFKWKIADKTKYQITWVALKTFTGMQLKYVMPKKFPPLLFALADEDAFAYCNKIPCEECAFRCKSGFVFYANIKGLGIVRMSMDRISMLNMDQIK